MQMLRHAHANPGIEQLHRPSHTLQDLQTHRPASGTRIHQTRGRPAKRNHHAGAQSMKVQVITVLSCETLSEIELPIDDWKQIKTWYVKWDTLHYTLDNQTWQKIDLNSSVTDIVDIKNPESVEIRDPKTFALIDQDE
jgi:hypothetical protein